MGILLLYMTGLTAQTPETADTRVDNMRYWKNAAEKGLVPYNPVIPFRPAEYKGSEIEAWSVRTQNSPDVPVTSLTNVSESENSVFVDPADNQYLLNSNNSTSWSGGSVGTLYGANYFQSANGGLTWGGSAQGAGGSNSGDPTTAINLNGRQFVGYIHGNYGQGVSYSDNGVNWTPVLVANAPSGYSSMLDKNHMWIDNSPSSPYVGSLYNAWTPFGGANDTEIEISRSTNNGQSWSTAVNISSAVNAGSHNQGVNIQTGPNGEVYVCWAIYDSWPSDETAIGFAKSNNGGTSYASATRIITNIRGIRTSDVSKNHRVNSFPVMAVDISNGPNRGNIYIVWTNIGTPGTNTGTNRSVYMIRSTNGGTSWSTPIRVNQGNFQNGKEAYFPWITCDPETGTLSVIFYDDRNTSISACEVFAANSFDGGNTWEDFAVSDVSFTPSPIPGLASSYMGDYLGIAARGGKVYPCWTDNRGGLYMTYVSPYETNNLERPTNLIATLNDATGQVDLGWSFNFVPGFLYFNIYRDGILLGTSTSTSFSDNLPGYGLYQYTVSAMHSSGESIPAAADVQWGDPAISFDPASFYVTLPPGGLTTEPLTITNTGELDLTFGVETVITTKGAKAYCAASGGCDEYISQVILNTINNSSGCNGYEDFTSISTTLNAGDTYSITVVNGNVWTADDLGVWIDWNQDSDFDDPGEEVVCEGGNSGQGTYSFTVPNGASPGQTVMRVRIKYSGSDCGDPCGTTSYGEVEDYSINVQGWLDVNPTAGTVSPGGSQTLNVTFDATGLAVGIYTANILVSSNDPNQPVTTIPATLNVSLGTPQISVNPSSMDFGDVEVGLTPTMQFSVSNSGTGPLSGTIATPPGFSVAGAKGSPENTISFNVGPGQTKNFDLTFAPTAVQYYSGNVVIDHNAGPNPELIAVTGTGIPGPEPDIAVNPDHFLVSLVQNNSTDKYLTISNLGDLNLNYTTNINYTDLYPGAKPQLFKTGYKQKNLSSGSENEVCPNKTVGYTYPETTGSLLLDLNLDRPSKDLQILGVEFDGTFLWATVSNTAGKHKICRYDKHGNLLNTYNQGTSSEWGMRDLAFDGTFLYSGDENGFYRINPSDGSVITLFDNTLGLETIRGLAYNPVNGHFYAAGWDTHIVEFGADGAQYGIYANPGLSGMFGLAYDGQKNALWIYNSTGNPETSFYEYSFAYQSLTGVALQVPLLSGLSGQLNGGAFISNGLVEGKIVLGGIVQGTPDDKLFALELGDAVTYSWLSITANGSGSVPGNNGSLDVELHFDASGLAAGTYIAQLVINSNDPYDPQVFVPCTLEVIDAIKVQLKVWLEGPFNGTEMHRFLNTYGHLPNAHPFNAYPWYYSGAESASPIPNLNIVDWVLVELRETSGGASTATSSTMIGRQAGFLLRDGSIVSADGSSLMRFNVALSNNYFVIVWQRNHLAVMSAFPLPENAGTYSYDFSTSSQQAYGGFLAHKEIAPGIWGMAGGDGNSNGLVNLEDKNDVWNQQVGSSGYLNGDFTMNANVDNADKNDIWNPNAGKGTQVPGDSSGYYKCFVPE